MKRFLLLWLFFSFPLLCMGAEKELSVVVDSQAAFDRLGTTIDNALKKAPESLVVEMRKGVYYYREKHLDLHGYNLPRTRLTIRCNGAQFLPAGPDYYLKGTAPGRFAASAKCPFDYKAGFADMEKGGSTDLRGPVKEALGRPEILDQGKGRCRIRVAEADLPEGEVPGVYILLSQWYRGRIYPVEKIESGYLYFRSEKLTSDRNALTDPDADYKVQQRFPHYILYNHPAGGQDLFMTDSEMVGSRPMWIHQGDVSNFMTLRDCLLGAFCLEGGVFLVNRAEDCLLRISNVQATEVSVKGCSFDGIRSDIIKVNRCSNLLLCNNLFTRSYRNCITLDNFTSGVEIRDNRFKDTGYMMNNDFCIVSQASHIWIHHNVFENFSYGAIGVGTFYMESIPASASGVIEQNEMYCTPSFLARPARLLMDSGALYTWTINKDITLRENYIHDLGGYGWNRGIFCDDGTVNVKIIRNRVERIAGDYCIYLRLDLRIETAPGSRIGRVNVGNVMEGNVVDGPVLFENRGEK